LILAYICTPEEEEEAEVKVKVEAKVGSEELLNSLFPVPCSIVLTGPVAQLNRAFDYGSKGFRFES
jgi:hypothetical protein